MRCKQVFFLSLPAVTHSKHSESGLCAGERNFVDIPWEGVRAGEEPVHSGSTPVEIDGTCRQLLSALIVKFGS
jgi:hypothetical protein